LAVQRASDRTVEWVYDLPPEIFFAQDEVLARHVAVAEAEACYEELALLYVAMTRAKRAMYVIVEPVGTSKSHNFPKLLQETLGEAWSAGDERWFESITPAQAESVADKGMTVVSATRAVRRPARTPSETKGGDVAGERLFALEEGGGAALFGRAVHDLLAQVEWAGAEENAKLAAVWRSGGAAGEEALACLRAPQLAEIWRKPVSPRVDVWRERAFEIVLDGVWVTGVFDRVVICRDENGGVSAATVYDFKTDVVTDSRLAEAARVHGEQMALYREAVARLTGLPVGTVRGVLVFTRLRRSVVLETAG